MKVKPLKMQRLTRKQPKQSKRTTNYALLLKNPKLLAEFKRDAQKNRQLPILQKYGLQNNQYCALLEKLGINPPVIKTHDGKGVMHYINNRPVNWREFNFKIMHTVCRRAGQ